METPLEDRRELSSADLHESLIAINFEAIPEELRFFKQWTCWKPEQRRGGKISKRPIDARVNDASTWLALDAARAKAIAEHLGLGFVLGCGIVGIDFDHVIDDDGTIHPVVARAIAHLASYAEVSPSGRGIHILLHGSIEGARKLGATSALPQREIYGEGRFFTFTGKVLGVRTLARGPRAQHALDELVAELFTPAQTPDLLDDETILALLSKAKNRTKALRLFRGDTQDYRSHSEADLAFCGILAYYSRDGAQIDRLFRRSRLMRPKWDERRGNSTYGADTIETALKRGGHRYRGPSIADFEVAVDEKKMGFFRLWWLLALRGKPPIALEVLCALCTFADAKTGEAYPTIERLERITGHSRSTVKKGLRILESDEVAILETTQRRNTSSKYRLRLARGGRRSGPTLTLNKRVPRDATGSKSRPLDGRILGQETVSLDAQIDHVTYQEQTRDISTGGDPGQCLSKIVKSGATALRSKDAVR